MSAYGTPFANRFARCINKECARGGGRMEFFDGYEEDCDNDAADLKCDECGGRVIETDCFGNKL